MDFLRRLNLRRNLSYVLIALSLAYCLYLIWALGDVYGAFIREKYADRKLDVDLVCDEIEYLELEVGYTDVLARAITRIDATVGTYAELFDRDLTGLSERTPLFLGAPFDPMEYPEFVEMVDLYRCGELTMWFDKPGAAPQNIHVYFRWVDDLLAVVGVSKYSVDTRISGGVQSGAIALIAVAGICGALTGASWRVERGRKHSG